MSQLLLREGAEVYGYAKQPPTDPSMYGLCGLKTEMESIEGDVRDLDTLRSVFLRVKPEFVVHMAAQPIVRESYRNPVETYETNVMGTVNVLECIRQTDSVNSFLNVTTDKVYKNREWEWGYRENEELNGYDRTPIPSPVRACTDQLPAILFWEQWTTCFANYDGTCPEM